MSMTIGDSLPKLTISSTLKENFNLEEFKGKKLVMYFYPKDNTPGCTQEGKDFSENYDEFQKLNTEIVGVSKDSLKKHQNFIDKFNFPFSLIADTEEELCKAMDVIKEKSMYGKKYMGIERSTFIFDEEGILTHEYRKVRVKGHVEEILETIQNL